MLSHRELQEERDILIGIGLNITFHNLLVPGVQYDTIETC